MSRRAGRALLVVALTVCMTLTGACSYLRGPLDRRSGFSSHLRSIETHIQNGDWADAATALKQAQRDWKKIEPLVQIDIDHDYVNQIHDNMALLSGFVDSRDKPGSLSLVRLVQETWRNLGSR